MTSEEARASGMLTPIEAARRLDVPVRRIYELVQEGTLPAYRGERSTIQVSAADVKYDRVDDGSHSLVGHRRESGHEVQGRLEHEAGWLAVEEDGPVAGGLGVCDPTVKKGQDQVVADRVTGQERARCLEGATRVVGPEHFGAHRPILARHDDRGQ